MKKIKKFLKIFFSIILGIVILITIVSTINNRIGNCSIEGEIKGLGTRLALVNIGDYSHSQNSFKLILVINNKFGFKTQLNKPGSGRMMTWNMLFKRASGNKPLGMRSKRIDFNLSPNQTITITGALKKYSVDYQIRGNVKSEQYSMFLQKNSHILEKETQLAIILDSLKYNGADKNLIDSLGSIFNKTREKYNNQRLKYIVDHPTHELSAGFLAMQNKDTLIKYLPILDKNLLLSNYHGKKAKKRVLIYNQTESGQLAPNIVQANKFNLADLKGKYVVLDFWGTWCAPCVKGFPKMREYYKKYNSKVEFVGIACNDKKSVWEKFIKEEGLEWTQLLNDVENNDLASKYNIRDFPTKVIIDKESRIVEIFKGETSAFYEKLDELLQE